MKQEDLKKRTKEILTNSYENMLDKIDKAISSGIIDVENADDNYMLPKILARAIIRDAENSIGEPAGNESRKEFLRSVDNVYAMI